MTIRTTPPCEITLLEHCLFRGSHSNFALEFENEDESISHILREVLVHYDGRCCEQDDDTSTVISDYSDDSSSHRYSEEHEINGDDSIDNIDKHEYRLEAFTFLHEFEILFAEGLFSRSTNSDDNGILHGQQSRRLKHVLSNNKSENTLQLARRFASDTFEEDSVVLARRSRLRNRSQPIELPEDCNGSVMLNSDVCDNLSSSPDTSDVEEYVVPLKGLEDDSYRSPAQRAPRRRTGRQHTSA